MAMMLQIPIANDENKVGKIVAVATVEISKRTSASAIAMIRKNGIIFMAAGAHAIRIPSTQISILEKKIARRRFT